MFCMKKKERNFFKNTLTYTALVSAFSFQLAYAETTQTVTSPKRTIHSPNMSFWAGSGLWFPVGNVRNYILQPTPMYELGFSKSIINFTPQSFFYAGLIFQYADSRTKFSYRTLEDIIKYGCPKATYTATNEQLFFGVEQTLGTPYFAGFIEAGGVFEQRYLLFAESKSEINPGYAHLTTFGGTANLGFNVRVLPKESVSYLLRFGVNFMVSSTERQVIQKGFESVNMNPMSYAPFASFMIRV